MNRLWLVASAGLVIVAGVSSDLSAQEKLVRAELKANPFFISVDYGEQRIKGQGVILRGEALDIDIGVSNGGRIGLLAADVEGAWKDHVTVHLRSGGYRDPDAGTPQLMACAWQRGTQRSRGASVDDQGNLVLNSGAYVKEVCRIDTAKLLGGKYTVAIDWSLHADRNSFRNVIPHDLPVVFEFEFRELVTEADQLDQMIHLAVRAIDEGRLPAAATLLDSALAIEPFSSSALILKGRLHLASGECAAAVAAWRLAANVFENGTDSRRQPHPPEIDSVDDTRVAEYWRERAKALRCE